MNKTKIIFIINPKSGTGKFERVSNLITQHLDETQFEIFIEFTKYAGHAFEMANEFKDRYDIIGVVGGDGTINEVVRAVVNHNVKLALLPAGSGNGLARTLNIPLKPDKAIKIINAQKFLNIDTVKINDKHFVNVAGMGFDAHIGYMFDNAKTRGFLSYIKITFKEFKKYKAVNYNFTIDGVEYNKKAFSISFANSTQFGNNAHIAPLAKIDDGIIDIAILNKFPLIASVSLGVRLFNKKLHKSKYYERLQGKNIEVISEKKLLMHIDGEPCFLDQNINMQINPKSLNVIVP